MKFLVDHPVIKWVMVIVGVVGSLLSYQWHIQETRAAAIQEGWLELDMQWNTEILSRLERIENILVGTE